MQLQHSTHPYINQRRISVLLFSLLLLIGACTINPPAVHETATERTTHVTNEGTKTDTTGFQPGEDTLALVPVASGLQRPLFVTHAGDGSNRLFFVEQRGVISLFRNNNLQSTPFLDISERVNDGGNEQGLLGLAFAPDFAQSGTFYVNYTDPQGATTISRFEVSTDDPDTADAASESLVLHIPQPAGNHNGGMIEFGPDGYLYIGTGDGGAAGDRFGNGQNPQSLLGKMLRIDVTTDPLVPYLIPPDNPWVEDSLDGEEVLDEIWAIGLRNPWRFSFDRATADLWIGDVGQNQYEEINVLPFAAAGGVNYGWPLMEGNHCFRSSDCDPQGLVLPVSEYTRSGGCSVTGGYVYRGEAYPALLGHYLYADFCSGIIWSVTQDDGGDRRIHELLRSGKRISSFGEDEQGELYIAAFDGVIAQVTVGR